MQHQCFSLLVHKTTCGALLSLKVMPAAGTCLLQGWTPLHSAVSAGYDLVVERLIGVDADVNARTSGGQTPLHYAVSTVQKLRTQGGTMTPTSMLLSDA